MTLRWALLLAIAPACGGTTTSALGGEIAGSYDLSFSSVMVARSGTIWSGVGAPALTTAHARLDITKSATGYAATLTPEWGEPQTFGVNVSTSTIDLAGEATFSSQSTVGTISDRVTSMHLVLSGGGLSGSGSVTGQENIFEGDVGDTSSLTATAVVAKDTTAPRVRDESSSGASTAHLPWDAIVIRASEPIDLEKVRALTSLGSVPLSREADPSLATALVLRASSWDGLSNAKLRVAGGVADPSGNASADFEGMWNVLDVGKPVASAALGTGTWGQFAMASAPCESGSCLEIGPAQSWCDAVGSGIGARLVATGKSRVVVRYRLRAKNAFGGPGQQTLRVAIARPGEASQSKPFAPQLVMGADQDYPYSSPWSTASVDLPGAASEVGVAVSIGSEPGFCGGPAPEPVPFVADIQSIAAE